MRRRQARRRAVGTRAPILVEAEANARWSLDFVHDQFACGRRFRVLNIVDDVTRECLAAVPDTSISGRRVARELADMVRRRGKPGMIVSESRPPEVHLERDPRLGRRMRASHGTASRLESRCRTASARVSTAHAGRTHQRDPVYRAGARPQPHRRVGHRRQRGPAPFLPRLHNPGSLRGRPHRNRPRSCAIPASSAASLLLTTRRLGFVDTGLECKRPPVREALKRLYSLGYLVAGVGFEPTTFRL